MSLTAHLLEARRRLLLALAGVAVASVAGWYLYEPALTFLAAPLADRPDALVGGLNFRSVIAPFTTRLAFACWAGFLLATPWWLTQAWLFLAPALRRREKTLLLAVAAPSSALFLAGVGLALTVLPRAVDLLMAQVPAGTATFVDVDAYLHFVAVLTVLVGVSFLFPVAEVCLVRLGVVPLRALVRAWRWVTVGAFTFSAVTNPLPDVWSMIVQSGLLLVLHCLALGICALLARRDARRGAWSSPNE